LNVLETTQILSTPAYQAYNAFAFLGIVFRVPNIGLRIGLEGSYSVMGMHTLGTMLGFNF
jgi:hypothetical protein